MLEQNSPINTAVLEASGEELKTSPFKTLFYVGGYVCTTPLIDGEKTASKRQITASVSRWCAPLMASEKNKCFFA